MTNQDKITLLLDGHLLNILARGQGKTTQLWVSTDMVGSGVLVATDPPFQPTSRRVIVDGAEIPSLSLSCGKIVPEKVDEVTQFLINAFGLPKRDAEHVVLNAKPFTTPPHTVQ